MIAELLFRVKYVEKAGTGTTDMIADCREAGLPEPDFEQHGPHFVVTLWRDWLTEAVIKNFRLNDRQKQAVGYVKRNERITNSKYQEIISVIRKTAARDLNGLVELGIFELFGSKRGAHYVVAMKK